MSEHRFREQLNRLRGDSQVVVATAPGPGRSNAPVAPGFVAAPNLPVVSAGMAQVYRLAYEAAIARITARRRCFAPFSMN